MHARQNIQRKQNDGQIFLNTCKDCPARQNNSQLSLNWAFARNQSPTPRVRRTRRKRFFQNASFSRQVLPPNSQLYINVKSTPKTSSASHTLQETEAVAGIAASFRTPPQQRFISRVISVGGHRPPWWSGYHLTLIDPALHLGDMLRSPVRSWPGAPLFAS